MDESEFVKPSVGTVAERLDPIEAALTPATPMCIHIRPSRWRHRLRRFRQDRPHMVLRSDQAGRVHVGSGLEITDTDSRATAWSRHVPQFQLSVHHATRCSHAPFRIKAVYGTHRERPLMGTWVLGSALASGTSVQLA
jgi:hypothetical protein